MFVKLTGIHQDTYVETGPIYIDASLIAYFCTYTRSYRKNDELHKDPTIYTHLTLTKDAGELVKLGFVVKETPDEVYNLLKGAK